jgi:hypothetical protein
VTQSTTAPIKPPVRKLLQNLAGPDTFNLVSLSLAALVFSLGKLTVYAADQSQYLVYSLSALAISQCIVVIALSVIGKIIFRTPNGKLQPVFVVTAVLIVNILGTILFELILVNWNLEPIEQSVFQRVISLSFTTFIYLGLGWVSAALDSNFKQVRLGKELLTNLSKKQLELSLTIRDARTFAIREISLEIQSTRGSLENFAATSDHNQKIENQINELQKTLDEVEVRVGKFSNQFPAILRMPKIYSKSKYSLSDIVNASTKKNEALPGLISAFAFFGFSSWLSYFLDEASAFFWGTILSISSFVIFWAYEKYVVTKVLSQPVYVRVLIYETTVISYLFFWLVILGFFAGDNSGAYGAALAYAAIPFVFFNGGAVLGGIVTLSQERRENLTTQATTLRIDMADLEKIRSEEDKVWKSLFVGDIALSPTTASVILRDATLTKDSDRVLAAIPNVNKLWKSVLSKLPTLA